MGNVRFFRGTQTDIDQKVLEGVKFTRIKNVFYCEDNEGLYFIYEDRDKQEPQTNTNFISKSYEELVSNLKNDLKI